MTTLEAYDVEPPEGDPGLVARVGRPAKLLLAGLVLLVVAVGAAFYATSPSPLPLSDTTLQASTPTDAPVFLGVVTAGAGFDRELVLAGVKVAVTSNTAVDVAPLLCRGVGVGVTTDPTTFCDELVDPEGQTFGAGDTIVLRVSSAEPAVAVIDRVRLAFRDGLQWATLDAGSPAVVNVLAR